MKKIINRFRFPIYLLSLLICIKCHSPESTSSLPKPNPVSAEITIDSTSSSTNIIGPEGGIIEIAGTDGWEYRFSIPKGFLVSEIEITMTPIASFTSIVLKDFTAGVQFEPSGLVLPGIAWLEMSGDFSMKDLVGVTYEGEGDEVALDWAEIKGSTIRVPITHFSGSGAGTPAPGAGDHSPSNPLKAMKNALIGAYFENDWECIGASHPLGSVLGEWYQAIFESMIEPKLEAATDNDLLLAEAINAVIEWTTFRQSASFFLCDDISEDLDAAPGIDRSNDLMARGLVNAVNTAADHCATAHDLGETKHMLEWQAVAQLLFGSDLDLSNQVSERCRGCLTFELQFESLVEVYEYTNTMTFSAQMKSTIEPLYPNSLGQIIGWIGQNETPMAFGPLIYTPKLNYPSKPGCEVIISRIETKSAVALLPEMKILDPIRNVPTNVNIVRPNLYPTEDGGENEDNNEEGENVDVNKDKNKLMLIFFPLEGTEYIEATCTDLLGSDNPDGAWGPYTFNGLHEEDMNYVYNGFQFMLEWGYGELFGWATSEKNALDIAKERTTFQLIHKAPRVEKKKK